MEICQLSKNLQLDARFSYFETINAFSLIEVLAETFNIYKPDLQTLKAEAYQNEEELAQYLIVNKELTGGKTEDAGGQVKLYIEDFLGMHNKYDIRNIDLLKINSIEILMSIISQAPPVTVR